MQEKFHMNKETGEVEALALICSVQVQSQDLKLSKQFTELLCLHHEQSKDLFDDVSWFYHCFIHRFLQQDLKKLLFNTVSYIK